MTKYVFKNKHTINFLTVKTPSPFPFALFIKGTHLTEKQKKEKLKWETNEQNDCINIIIDKYITQLERFRRERSLRPLPEKFFTLRPPTFPAHCFLFRSRVSEANRLHKKSTLQ